MTRLATTFDRLAALVFGLALIALGVGLLTWNTGYLPHAPAVITAPGLVTAIATAWWPWALAGVGLVHVLVALRWLLVHTPKARLKTLRLSSADAGTISADLDEVAGAAARALEQCPGAHSAKGRAVVNRGVRIIDLSVTAQSPTSLTALLESVDVVGSQLAGVLGDVSVASRTSLHLDRRSHRDRVT